MATPTRRAKPEDDRALLRRKLREARLLRSAEEQGAPLVEEDGAAPFVRSAERAEQQPWYLDRMGHGVTK